MTKDEKLRTIIEHGFKLEGNRIYDLYDKEGYCLELDNYNELIDETYNYIQDMNDD